MFEFKQLYIRKGNVPELVDVLIIGDKAGLGARDLGYTIPKGLNSQVSHFILKKDPYTKSENLYYIHVTPNILLDTKAYSRDHQVHKFVKDYCKDLVTWDGEADQGKVRSREAFIINDPSKTAETIEELYSRIEDEIHGKRKTVRQAQIAELAKKSTKELLLLLPRVAASTLTLPFKKKTRKKMLKKIWKG